MTDGDTKNPTGAMMVERTYRVRDRVREILQEFPSSRGNDTLLIYRYLRRFHPEVRITFTAFEAMMRVPAFETIRRRRQELQVEEPELRPTLRTMRKRYRREKAMRHDFGKGMTLEDYTVSEYEA